MRPENYSQDPDTPHANTGAAEDLTAINNRLGVSRDLTQRFSF